MDAGFRQTADAARRLRDGGILLLATDTVPGLHCRADHREALTRLLALKASAPDKPLLVLAGARGQVALVAAAVSAAQAVVCDRYWPGPFSLILRAAAGVSPAVTGGGSTVAVRIPALASLRELLLAAGGPVVSTSANRTGFPHARSMADAWREFGPNIDGWWTGGEADDSARAPSALVDLTVDPPRVLRTGPLRFEG